MRWLLVFTGCNNENTEWNPIFEDTGFGYFNAGIERSISLIDEAAQSSDKNDPETTKKKLDSAKQIILRMKDYYVPLTTIRQKVHDAEGFYKIKNINKAKTLLKESGVILDAIESYAKNKVFDKVVIELKSMIDKAEVE